MVTHQNYTVCWICALPLEAAAARALLDKSHPRLSQPSTDDNSYTLGEICGHNIIIAYLPSGVYGTTSAATVVAQMRSTFSAVRFCLMVGIGGGVPSEKNDIRLGDVVVSKPTGILGGILQYDYGKAITGGVFQQTGMMNQPPQVLLNAIARLQADEILGVRPNLSKMISDVLNKNPEMSALCSRPTKIQDQLFKAAYDHPGGEDQCDNCDEEYVVYRKPRASNEPQVHYGLIASGNQVMRDGQARDRLAKQSGILCFEMEAAGLMNQVPCLVIRGVCDYSDSHKNKQWQGYAALTAAAYTKILLSVVSKDSHPEAYLTTAFKRNSQLMSHGSETESEAIVIRSHSNITEDTIAQRSLGPESQVGEASLAYKQNMIILRSDSFDIEGLFTKLSDYDHDRVHRRLARKRLSGTAQWFLDHLHFKAWFEQKKATSLWCSGKIGSGKTMIATAVVDRILEDASPAVYFYCESEQREQLGAAYIMASFIKQLFQILQRTSKPYPSVVLKKIEACFRHDRTQPDFEDLAEIFRHLFDHVLDTIYVIDGLENLESDDIQNLFGVLRSLSTRGSRILLLSRDQLPGYLNISTAIPGTSQISTTHNILPDIKIYIDRRTTEKMMSRPLVEDALLLQEIKDVLLTKSSGIFLWVYLQLEILWDTCFTDAEIQRALSQLPKDLEETYSRCVRRMKLQDSRTLKVLKWISFSSRPLEVEELKEAVAFDLSDSAWNSTKIPRTDFVVGCCANLAVVDPTDGCVRFAHPSVKKYLEKYQESKIPQYPASAQDGELECGEFSVVYLSFADFGLQVGKMRGTVTVDLPDLAYVRSQALASAIPVADRLLSLIYRAQSNSTYSRELPDIRFAQAPIPDRSKYKFLDYATENWLRQTKDITFESSIWNKFERLVLCFNDSWNIHPWSPGGRSQHSHLHGLFGWGVKEQHIPILMIAWKWEKLLRTICNIPLIGENLPALHVASKLGYLTIVERLVGICEVNAMDHQGNTALHHAAAKGHLQIALLLVNLRGIEVDRPSRSQRTPLWLAASNGHEEVVELLAGKGASIERRDLKTDQTPLLCAVRNGHLEASLALISKGADLDARDMEDRTSLSWSLKRGLETLTKLLLEKGASPHCKDVDVQKLMVWAAEKGHGTVTSLLLANGAPVDSEEPGGLTAACMAAANGHTDILKLLLEKGASPNLRDSNGNSPVAWAARSGHADILVLLLEKGANPNLQGHNGNSPVSWAARYGHALSVKLLLEAGANPNLQDSNGNGPVAWAARYGHAHTVKLLLEKGANPNSQDGNANALVAWAVTAWHKEVVRRLRRHTAALNWKDDSGRTRLSLAAENGDEEAVRTILKNKTDSKSNDMEGGMPLSWVEGNGASVETVDHGVDLESKDFGGWTALTWAAFKGHQAVVKLLLEHGADINSEDDNGRTPLSWAAAYDHLAIVDFLLEKGAHLEAKDNIYWTPLSWASSKALLTMTRLLLEKGADPALLKHSGPVS